MTEQEDTQPLAEEEGPPSSKDPMAQLLKRSLAPAALGTTKQPSILRGVQRRIRKRSRGKFFADGWSTTDARVSHALIAGAMLLILIIAYFALGPTGMQ
jgi:hypothetical protein